MRTKAIFHQCAEAVIAQVREHWTAKEAYLDEMIGTENPEETQLDLYVHCEPEANRFAVRAVLPLRSAALTAEALDENPAMALDRVAGLLAQAVQRHRGGASPSAEKIDVVEEASMQSFPASDAPAWIRVSVLGLS